MRLWELVSQNCLEADSLHTVSYSHYYSPIVQIRKLSLGEIKVTCQHCITRAPAGTYICLAFPEHHFAFPFKKYLFIYVAASSLRYGTQDLGCSLWDLQRRHMWDLVS